MAGRGIYQLLLEALQESRSGMAPDDPAEIARRYPRNPLSDGADAEAPTTVRPFMEAPQRDPKFRQLSRAPFAAQAQLSGGSDVSSNSPEDLWTAAQNAEPEGADGTRPALPWWVPPSPSRMLPVAGGRFALSRAGGLGGPLPWPDRVPKIQMPAMPEAWKTFGPLLMMYPELVRQRLLGEGDENEVGSSAAAPILELYQKRRRAGSKASRPPRILGAPGIVPDDAPIEAPSTDDDDYCARRFDKEMDRCWSKSLKSIDGCKARAWSRRIACDQNGGVPPADELDEWQEYD